MAIYKDAAEKKPTKPKCIMCEGDLDTATWGSICNTCRDRMRKGN